MITEVWRRGSVIGSWLLDLTAGRCVGDADSAELRGPRIRFGRGTLDGGGGDRRGRAGAGAERGAVRALQLARRSGFREPRVVGDAARFRWPRRKSGAAGRGAEGLGSSRHRKVGRAGGTGRQRTVAACDLNARRASRPRDRSARHQDMAHRAARILEPGQQANALQHPKQGSRDASHPLHAA